MPSYETAAWNPPAPIARVTLIHPENGATYSGVPLLMDTGADITSPPREMVEGLGIQPEMDARSQMMSFDGTTSFAPVAILRVVFLGLAFRGRYPLINGDTGVLGRDILNHLTLLFDGPRQQWSQPDS